MNPTAGSFTINPRLQRHFSVFAVSFPGKEALRTIYDSILSQHVAQGGFSGPIQRSVERIVNAQLKLHQKVCKSMYIFGNCVSRVILTIPSLGELRLPDNIFGKKPYSILHSCVIQLFYAFSGCFHIPSNCYQVSLHL